MRGNFFYKKIAEKIINKRKNCQMTQEKLAMLSEIDRTYLARIEEGKANPSIKILNKICRKLKIKLHQLF
ncbi:MAG: helix-turn-helix transcriptional regulator [Microgenomates group bacterium]|nr:helix-turn-helix transcriptional regulator [Microgenomates group bacterium]